MSSAATLARGDPRTLVNAGWQKPASSGGSVHESAVRPTETEALGSQTDNVELPYFSRRAYRALRRGQHGAPATRDGHIEDMLDRRAIHRTNVRSRVKRKWCSKPVVQLAIRCAGRSFACIAIQDQPAAYWKHHQVKSFIQIAPDAFRGKQHDYDGKEPE